MALEQTERVQLAPSEYAVNQSNPGNYHTLQLASEASKTSLDRAFEQHEGFFIFAILIALVVIAALLIQWVRRSALPKVKQLATSGAEAATVAVKQLQDRNKVCPFCAETIKREATVCKHCLRTL